MRLSQAFPTFKDQLYRNACVRRSGRKSSAADTSLPSKQQQQGALPPVCDVELAAASAACTAGLIKAASSRGSDVKSPLDGGALEDTTGHSGSAYTPSSGSPEAALAAETLKEA